MNLTLFLIFSSKIPFYQWFLLFSLRLEKGRKKQRICAYVMEVIDDTCKQNVFELCWNQTVCEYGTNSSSRCIWKQQYLCAWVYALVTMTRNCWREEATGHRVLGIYRAQIQNSPLQWTPVLMDSNCPATTATCSGVPYFSYNQWFYTPVNDVITIKQRKISKPALEGVLETHGDSTPSQLSPAGAERNVWVNGSCLYFKVKTTSQGSATLRNNKTSSIMWYGKNKAGVGKDLWKSRGCRWLHLEKNNGWCHQGSTTVLNREAG